MDTINIHEAKTHLSRLIDKATKGAPFIIAKAGRPLVKVTAVSAPDPETASRVGFLASEFDIPDDFNTMAADQIERFFDGIE